MLPAADARRGRHGGCSTSTGFRPRGTYPATLFDATTPQRVESILGACLLVQREALEAPASWTSSSSSTPRKSTSADGCRIAGWHLYWIPEAVIVHYGGASTTQVALRMFVELYRSKVQYFRKHFGRRGALGYKAVLLAAALPRVGLASVAMAVMPAQRAKWRALLTNYSALLAQLPAL